MNNSENSPTGRMIARASKLREKDTLHDSARDFPSYLRLFDIFFGLLISKSHWGAARLTTGCSGRFPTAHARVAFL